MKQHYDGNYASKYNLHPHNTWKINVLKEITEDHTTSLHGPLSSSCISPPRNTHTHNWRVRLCCLHASLTINELEVRYSIYVVLWAHTPIYYPWGCRCHSLVAINSFKRRAVHRASKNMSAFQKKAQRSAKQNSPGGMNTLKICSECF